MSDCLGHGLKVPRSGVPRIHPMCPGSAAPPQRQRVAAYAVIVRDGHILLSLIAPQISPEARWTLPGGGIDFGEEPARAVVREVHEETGLECTVGDPLWIGSVRRVVDRSSEVPGTDLHSVRLVYAGWVPADSPEPHVVEVDGSTIDARWVPVADVVSGAVPTVPMVGEALAHHATVRRQRVAAYALVVRDDVVLLTRHSPRGPRPGTWSLPGGGVEHGERPAHTVVREVAEETGLTAGVGDLLGVHDEHFTGTAPTGLEEDFHGIALVFAAAVGSDRPGVRDPGGTTDAADWVPLADVASGAVPVSTLVTAALAMVPGR
jgi:8-oxo-dGTP diphosphatase